MDKVGAPQVTWRKSNHSSANGECVEVANLDVVIGVRDSKATNTGHLALTRQAWSNLLTEVKSGRFDDGTN